MTAASTPRIGRPGPPPVLSPDAGGGLLDEVTQRDAEGVGEKQEILQVRHTLRVLPSMDRAMVPPDELPEL